MNEQYKPSQEEVKKAEEMNKDAEKEIELGQKEEKLKREQGAGKMKETEEDLRNKTYNPERDCYICKRTSVALKIQ